MKESIMLDVDHELNGATVYDPATLEVVATNIIVRGDGTTCSVGTATVSGDVGVFHGSSADDMMATIEARGWQIEDTEGFIQQPHELTAAVDAGEFDRVLWKH